MERVAELVRVCRRTATASNTSMRAAAWESTTRNGSPQGFAEKAAEYAAALLRPLRDLKVHLLLEPGRSIVGPAGALLTRVLYRKTNGPKKFLVVDAAMNDLVRPSLYDAYHEIVPVRMEASAAATKLSTWSVQFVKAAIFSRAAASCPWSTKAICSPFSMPELRHGARVQLQLAAAGRRKCWSMANP